MLNIADYGCDPTAQTDCTDKIRKALDDAEAAGQPVLIPAAVEKIKPAKFLIKTKLVTPPHSLIMGQNFGLTQHYSYRSGTLDAQGKPTAAPYPAPAKGWGSTLMVDVREGNAGIVLNEGSAMKGIRIYDPMQATNKAPIPTPPTRS